MTQAGSRLHKATPALDGILLASLAATFLAPILAYAASGVAAGFPVTGAVAGLFVAPFFLFVTPLAFIFIFLCAAALGWCLHRLNLRHVAVFSLAGMLISLAAWGLTPFLIGLSDRPPFLSAEAGTGEIMTVVAAIASAGAANGTIYWLVLRKFARRRQ